jgi:hypothetical protein
MTTRFRRWTLPRFDLWHWWCADGPFLSVYWFRANWEAYRMMGFREFVRYNRAVWRIWRRGDVDL